MEKLLVVSAHESQMRLDRFLQSNLEGISRTKIHVLLEKGSVTVNQQKKKPSYHVKINDSVLVSLPHPQPYQLKPYASNLAIVYEDDDILLIDKPQGLSVHPAHSEQHDTLVNVLTFMGKNLSSINPYRAGIVHRLDKETSGIMVIAKTNASHLDLVAQFRDRTVKKEYLALAWGRLIKDRLTVNMPMKRDEHNRVKMKISFINSKQAYTDIEVKERLSDATLLLIKPLTGRMHQIRVHLRFLEHPIIGDKKYGLKDGFKDMYLHAHRIGFLHPRSRAFMQFTSVMPQRFSKFIAEHKRPC